MERTCANMSWRILRHQIGVIFQDFIRYDLTVKENIGLGQIEHVDNMNRIVRASEQGGTRSLYCWTTQGIRHRFGTHL